MTSLLPYESLNLYISDASYTFEPMYADSSILRESLVIDRDSSVISMNVPPSATLGQEEVVVSFGIVGFLGLNGGDQVIVITGREKVGALNGSDVYRLLNVDILPVQRQLRLRSDSQIQDDETYVSLISDLLKSGHFYFSYGYDLTRSCQSQALLPVHLRDRPLWQRADERFYWNLRIQEKLVSSSSPTNDVSKSFGAVLQKFDSESAQKPSQVVLSFQLFVDKTSHIRHLTDPPNSCVVVQISPITIHGRAIVYSLISRRSKYRMGVRYHSRGIDDTGNVSNFVETEQLIELPETGTSRSYLQIRGSIPVFWRQVTNVMYKPALVIDNKPTTEKSFLTHANDLIARYGRVVMVNMIDKHGYEEGLGREFFRLYSLANNPQLRYTHFDFHKECKKMRWDRISLLLDELDNELHSQGYCSVNGDGKVTSTQQSIIRTNCIDCLDRTNVVQSVFAKQFLTAQLRELNILSGKEFIDEIPSFIELFRNVWANNADAISMQYSGTGALKTDFTRTGKRSFEGVLQDFSNSVVRYIKNNFFDGYRQDAYDFFLGNYVIVPGKTSPFAYMLPSEVVLAITGLGVAGVLFMYTMLFTRGYLTSLGLLLLSLALFSGTILFVLENGRSFVSTPHLVSIDMSIPAKHVPKTRKHSHSGTSTSATLAASSKWTLGSGMGSHKGRESPNGIQMSEIDKTL